METIKNISKWFDNWGYRRTVVENLDKYFIFFYVPSHSKKIIYVICLQKNNCYIHIGNVYLANNIVQIGFNNVINENEMTSDILLANILNITDQINQEEHIEYYDEAMKYTQKFKDVMQIITQYIEQDGDLGRASLWVDKLQKLEAL